MTTSPAADAAAPARVLVVVPAWNEQGAVAQTVTQIRAACPAPRSSSWTTAPPTAPPSRGRAPARWSAASPSTSASAAPCAPATATRCATATTWRCRSTPTASTTRATSPLLLDALDDADVVIGARFAGDGPLQGARPAAWAMVLLAADPVAAGRRPRLTDVTSRLPGVPTAGRSRCSPTHYPAEYLGDTVESLVIAVRAGCTVTQVPVDMRPRQAGRASHTPMRAAVYLAARRRRAGAGPRARAGRRRLPRGPALDEDGAQSMSARRDSWASSGRSSSCWRSSRCSAATGCARSTP